MWLDARSCMRGRARAERYGLGSVIIPQRPQRTPLHATVPERRLGRAARQILKICHLSPCASEGVRRRKSALLNDNRLNFLENAGRNITCGRQAIIVGRGTIGASSEFS